MRPGRDQFPGQRRAAGGFGLVEILVALAVGAIALLGAAVVAAHGLQAGGAALRAALATNLAADMAGRLGVNRRALAGYAGEGPARTAGCTKGGVTCNPADRAAADWFEWLAAIRAQLPRGATAAIEPATETAAACPCTIEVRWPEPGEAHPARVRLVLP